MSLTRFWAIHYWGLFCVGLFLFSCGSEEVHVVSGGGDDVSLAGGEYERIDPHTNLRPENWDELSFSTPNRSKASSVWAPRSSVETNREATKITIAAGQEVIIDHGVWWDSNIESAGNTKKQDVYVFLNFRPVGFFMHKYRSEDKNEVKVEKYLKAEKIKQATTEGKKFDLNVKKDKEIVTTILIPNDYINRRVNDLRVVKVNTGDDAASRLSPQVSSWSMRLVARGKEKRSKNYTSKDLRTADRVTPGGGLRTVVTGGNRVFLLRKSLEGFQFPISEDLFELEGQHQVRVWMAGETRGEVNSVMTLVQDGEVTGGTPVSGKIPKLPYDSAEESEQAYAVRAPFSLGTTRKRVRAFLFFSPLGQRMGPGRVKASNPHRS